MHLKTLAGAAALWAATGSTATPTAGSPTLQTDQLAASALTNLANVSGINGCTVENAAKRKEW